MRLGSILSRTHSLNSLDIDPVRAVVVFSLAVVLPGSAAIASPPPNDNFASAVVIAGTEGRTPFSVTDASKEAGEPHHAGSAGGRSVWFTWMAPSSRRVSLWVQGDFYYGGAPLNSLLAVYVGDRVDTLVEVKSNDDTKLGNYYSTLAFDAIQGTRYRIAVDSVSGDAPDCSRDSNPICFLYWAPTPTNDDFENGEFLSGSSGEVVGTTAGATREDLEHFDIGNSRTAGYSVWYRWTAPSSSLFRFGVLDSVSPLPVRSFGTSVFVGESLGDLAWAPYEGRGFQGTAGATYRIAVDSESPGAFKLIWSVVPPPDNDQFATAKPISGAVGMVEGTVVAATTQVGEPADLAIGSELRIACPATRSVWYRWTAPTSSTAIFTISGALGVAVYGGTQLSDLMPRAVNASGSRFIPPRVLFNVVAGGAYYILVANCSTLDDYYTFTLSWTFSGAGAANDNFASAQEISGNSGTVPGSTVGATLEIGEPQIDTIVGLPDRSVWYHWTAPSSGPWVFTTDGAYVENGGNPIDSVLGVYNGGNSFATLEVVASNDDFFTYNALSRFSSAVFNAEAGKQYWIGVSGLRGQGGLFRLNWAPVPQNDQFANAENISGVSGSVTGTNLGASRDTEEPDPGDWGTYAFLDRSVWYRWTAPSTGRWAFDTRDSDFNTALGVYVGGNLATLVEIARNNDVPDPRCPDSEVYTGILAFDAEAGRDYYIVVDSGNSGNTGSAISRTLGGFFALRWRHSPENDQFASAQEISGEQGMISSSTEGATVEAGQLSTVFYQGGASVWFRWQAPQDAIATFDTLSSDRPVAIDVRNEDTFIVIVHGGYERQRAV